MIQTMATESPTSQTMDSPRLRMTYEEFLAWADEDTHAEWVDGEVIVFMPTKRQHQSVLEFLWYLLTTYVRQRGLGDIVVAPFEMRARPGGSAREPDLLFVAKSHSDRLSNDRLSGPADLVVEFVSDDSVRRDRIEKFREYAAAGIPEYWIIDPRPGKQRADFFAIDETGAYALFGTEDDARVESRVVAGFWLDPAWLWQAETLSPTATAYRILGLSPEQIDLIDAMLGAAAPATLPKAEPSAS